MNTVSRVPLVTDLFSCTCCGFCCHGETTISLDETDQRRMAHFLGLSREECARRFWRITGRTVQMQVQDGHCIFYNDREGCTVHEGRPWRCRQWPLHPSILTDEANFSAISASCPGLNKDLGYEEFCRIFRTLIASGSLKAKGF